MRQRAAIEYLSNLYIPQQYRTMTPDVIPRWPELHLDLLPEYPVRAPTVRAAFRMGRNQEEK